MSALLLNEQAWLTLLYLVVLPLLVVGVAVASFRGRSRRRNRSSVGGPQGTPCAVPALEVPTAMELSPPHDAHAVVGGERIVAVGAERSTRPAGGAVRSSAELEARMDTIMAELEAARRTIQRQDVSLAGVREELRDARTELHDQELIIAGLRSDLSARREGAERLPALLAELEGLRSQVSDLMAEREFLRSGTGSSSITAPLEEELVDDDDHDDDEIVVPMPASAADEFDLDEDEQATGARGRQLRRSSDQGGQTKLATAVLDDHSMVFDGTIQPVAMASDYAGLSEGSWTVEAWVKPACSRLGRALLSYAVAGSSRVVITAGGPRPSLGVEIDGEQLAEQVEPRLIADTWQHIAVAWDTSDGRTTIYLGGALAYSGELASGARIPRGGRLLLGQQFARGQQVFLPARAFEGSLAEVRVWPHVRNPSAIRRDTHRQAPHEPGASFWRVR